MQAVNQPVYGSATPGGRGLAGATRTELSCGVRHAANRHVSATREQPAHAAGVGARGRSRVSNGVESTACAWAHRRSRTPGVSIRTRERLASRTMLRVMRHAVTVVVAIACARAPAHAAPQPAAPPTPNPADPRAALEPLARSLIDGEYCVGIVVGLISPSAPPRVLAWGETARGNHKLPDGNTLFEIGSI